MHKKKQTTVSYSSNGGKSKQMPPPAKGKTATKQTPITASGSQSINTATGKPSSEDFSSVENHILFWLDSNIDLEDDHCRNTIAQLQSVVNTIHVFNDSDQCVNYLNKFKKQKVLMVVSGGLGQHIVPHIHSMPQLTAVFVFCSNKSIHESWAKNWFKIRDIFTDIDNLCESLKRAARQCDEDSIDISFVSANDIVGQSLDQLDQSFMYTQLIKEILLELEYDDESVKDLVTYCRDRYSNNQKELKNIETFHTGYHLKSPIWWYTYECFIYHLLNWALRDQEVDVIIRMAFFICDLHRHIEKLHSEQSKNFQKEFMVYRGQGMSSEKFEKMKKTKGGLISFNNFLSTSIEKEVALKFVTNALKDPSYLGVLFIITVDPSISSAPFANLDKVSYYDDLEKEILFSMHTVFRIGEIKPSNTNDRLWHVYLSLTSDSDKQLNALIERMRVEIEGPSALYRLGALMIKLGEFRKAEEVYETLRKRTFDELETAHLYYQLGYIMDNQRIYDRALTFYRNALTIYLNKLPPDHPNIATCYNNIGIVYDNMAEYREALSFYEKALEIYQKTLPDDHPNVATSYNSIGLIYNSMGEYSKALSYCKTARDIFVKSLPSTHPLLATSYNNIGLVYANMKKYSEAVASYKRAVEIGQQALPPNHPNLVVYRQNLESVRKKGNK